MAEPGQLQTPAAPQKIPGFPESFEVLSFAGFDGLNTKPARAAIGDQQLFICDNFMPIGKNNLRALSDIGSSIYGAPSGLTIQKFGFGNIANSNIGLVFLSDGSIAQINTDTMVSSAVAGANTISSSAASFGIAQWGSQFMQIAAPQGNGYFIWDGTIFYQKGSVGPFVNITNSGQGYKTAPTITATGGSGTGVAFSATLTSAGNITIITVTNAGSGYGLNDVVVCSFSGGGSGGTTAIGTAVLNSTGNVISISVLSANQGAGYNLSSVTVSIKGGGGAGATAVVSSLSGTGINSVLVTSGSQGAGYSSVPTVVFTDPLNPVAQASVPIMPSGVRGTALENFAGRVWLVNGDAPTSPPPQSLNIFSAPGVPTDFNSGDGAGAFIANDSFVRVGYHAIKQANGFLYLLGDSSINYISSVNTTGSPPITTFSNTNVDPQIGCPWPDSCQVFSRRVVFANTFGIFAMEGGAVRKVSLELDGIYTSVAATGHPPTVGGIEPSGAVALVYGIHIYCLLLPILDQVSGLQVNKILCWDGQKWFTYQPSKTITYVSTQEIHSVMTAYGTDGSFIYPLFNASSTAITKTVQSKLWDNPQFFMQKRAQRFWALASTATNQPITLNYNIDNETGSASGQVTGLNVQNWVTQTGQPATWTTASGATATWVLPGSSFFSAAVDWAGQLLGLTVSSTSKDVTLIEAALGTQQYKPQL